MLFLKKSIKKKYKFNYFLNKKYIIFLPIKLLNTFLNKNIFYFFNHFFFFKKIYKKLNYLNLNSFYYYYYKIIYNFIKLNKFLKLLKYTKKPLNIYYIKKIFILL